MSVGNKLSEAVMAGSILPIFFCFIHWIDGARPLITEFEAGAIFAAVGLRLIEALQAATRP